MKDGRQPRNENIRDARTRPVIPPEPVCPNCQRKLPVLPVTGGQPVRCPHCGADLATERTEARGRPDGDPLIGSMLGGCKIVERIGRGGMAVVYKAEQIRLRRPVALKVMLPGLLTQDAGGGARFLEEARLAAKLEHPNVVHVYDAGQESGRYYMVMQFIDGETVKDLTKRRGRIPSEEALSILLQAARGLDAAHRRGMVHRDIKPSNLLVDSRGAVRVSDFGLAKCLYAPSGLTSTGQTMGTPHYMSPEQCRGEEADIRSDIYALGVTAFEMLTGRLPFYGQTPLAVMYEHERTPVPHDALVGSGVPDSVAALVEKMMAKSPEDRHTAPEKLIADAERLAGEGAERATPRPSFDDRESFKDAEAALAVICRRCERFADEGAAWEAFIDWSGLGEADYLRRIRAGQKYIFYGLLHDLYDFAEYVCGENVARQIGEQLSREILDRHLPDILEATLVRTGELSEQIIWLIDRFVTEVTGSIYKLEYEMSPADGTVRISVRYRFETEMVDYLRRTGHNPERAFGNSFSVFEGALRVLTQRTIFGMVPERLESKRRPLRGEFILRLTPENRFHYENIIAILMDYVRQLGERKPLETEPAFVEVPPHVSRVMNNAWRSIQKAAASNETVLLCGESGTGKSYYARIIHETSAGKEGAFVEVGMTSDVGSDNLIQSNLFGHVRGAFTGADEEKQGLFALADGGTIFLDEIGDASPEVQAKLLRVIESKTFRMLGGLQDVSVDVRIIAATNKDLAALVRQGRFREDLFYRLNVISIMLPPLRERPADMPGLVGRLFEKVFSEAGRQDKQLSDEAFQVLCSYHWPGNVRELENALRHAVAFSEGAEVTPEDFPATVIGAPARAAEQGVEDVVDPAALRRALSAAPPVPEASSFEWPAHVDYARRAYMRALIRHHHGDLRKIARHWNRSSENTLLKLIREFGLEEELRAARKGGE